MFLSLVIGLAVFFTATGLSFIEKGFGFPAMLVAALIAVPIVVVLIVGILQRAAVNEAV